MIIKCSTKCFGSTTRSYVHVFPYYHVTTGFQRYFQITQKYKLEFHMYKSLWYSRRNFISIFKCKSAWSL